MSLSLLSESASLLGHHLASLSHLCPVVKIHPFSHVPWIRMAEEYSKLGDEKDLPFSGKRGLRMEAEAFCLVRAHVLLRATEKTSK